MNLKGSIAYRIERIYKAVGLLKLSLRRYRRRQITSTYELRFLCGQKQIPLLIASLHSIVKINQELPYLSIISDGSIVLEDIPLSLTKKFNKFLFIESADMLKEYKNYESLHKYAELFPAMKKYIAIFYKSRSNVTLFVDPDILWYKSLQDILREVGTEDISMCYDFQYSYDMELIDKAAWKDLMSFRPLNSGVTLFRVSSLDGLGFADSVFSKTAVKGEHVTEQTLVAKLVIDRQSKVIPFHLLPCTYDDRYSLIPNKEFYRPMIARHYVTGTRHLFWRDVFWKI